MKAIYCCVLLLVVNASGEDFPFSEQGMPIRLVRTSLGQGDLKRIDYLMAEIHPRHVTTNQRVNFPTSGPLERFYQAVKAPGDERGHLVASQFSGPPTWYNLSPQNARVNRNLGYQSITTDWYGAECEVRQFLNPGGNRHVDWRVTMSYVGDSNRPDTYHLVVHFYENGVDNGRAIDTTIRNPFKSEDSTFWICRTCRSNQHGPDGCTRG